MDKDEIIEMARQVGVDATGNEYWPFFIEELEAFAKLVEDAAFKRWAAQTKLAVQDEREACAKLADEIDPVWESVSAAIRARGETE